MGTKIVAIADKETGLVDLDGLPDELFAVGAKLKSISTYKKAHCVEPDKVLELNVDILIPASVTDVINEKNKHKIKAAIIVEGANIPMSEDIEEEFYKRGTLVVPDFVANSGGVISSYAEYRGFSIKKAFELIESKFQKNITELLKENSRKKESLRATAMKLAQKRVEKKMEERNKRHAREMQRKKNHYHY
jgi:glutamate dehydrogenase/leucine dehydrogenase